MQPLALENMTVQEKLMALEQLWEDLIRNQNDIPSPGWHGDVLTARADRVADGSAEYLDWSAVKQQII